MAEYIVKIVKPAPGSFNINEYIHTRLKWSREVYNRDKVTEEEAIFLKLKYPKFLELIKICDK